MIDPLSTELAEFQAKYSLLFSNDIYSLQQDSKAQMLLDITNELHRHHLQQSAHYRCIMQASDLTQAADRLDNIPFLAVRLFKQLALKSVADADVFRILQSSGTTSQTPAQVYLDKDTSARQSKALVKILQDTLGKQRLPMLIIDAASTVRNTEKFSARAAGIQGMAFFGRDHTYALNDDMQPDWPVINAFCQKYPEQPVLMFGFTFMLWKYFVKPLVDQQKSLPLQNAIVLHSGGWKKLVAEKVDNQVLKQHIQQTLGATRVHNFYGMAEQVGTIFVECNAGKLHAPVLADVIVRDPASLRPMPEGETGLIQVISALPTSYPGHSILTEDLGTITGVDDCSCGRLGKTIQIVGRLAKTEVRGCSDTQSAEASGEGI